MPERVAVDCIVGLCPSGVGDHKCRPFGRLQNLDGIFVVIKIGMLDFSVDKAFRLGGKIQRLGAGVDMIKIRITKNCGDSPI